MPARSAKAAASAPARKPRKRKEAAAAATFDYKLLPSGGGIKRPIWLSPTNGRTMIDAQKFRNNYYTMKGPLQAQLCRAMAEKNWFLREVLGLRHASIVEDFKAVDGKGASMEAQYDFTALLADIVHEDLITGNVVCMWRKGKKLPTITVHDMEVVEYSAPGGIERIKLTYAKDEEMAKDKANEALYKEELGEKVFKAISEGGEVTIIKGDEEWDFEVMVSGKRRGVFQVPALVPIMDALDFMELMGVGDWNLAWFRKDVIRLMKKGYKVGTGSGAGINSVDITQKDIKDLGEGASAINGNSNIPANHDVEFSYLTISPENFDPKQVDSTLSKLMLFGGIEAVVLLGSFSQQNGAAPSLMRNARASAFARRGRVENLLGRIFATPEFRSLKWGLKKGQPFKYHWGVKSLYSMDELLSLVSETNDGTLSPQTRRDMLGFDNATEVENMKEAHADREGYAPPFEAGQALLPAMFPEDLNAAAGDATPPPGDPGRPPGS